MFLDLGVVGLCLFCLKSQEPISGFFLDPQPSIGNELNEPIVTAGSHADLAPMTLSFPTGSPLKPFFPLLDPPAEGKWMLRHSFLV